MPIINQVVAGSGGGGSVNEPYLEYDVNASGRLIHSTTTNRIINLMGATSVGGGILAYAYQNNTNITGTVDLSSLTAFDTGDACSYMFSHCTGITKIDLSGLGNINKDRCLNNACEYCTNLVSADLSSVYRLYGAYTLSYMFSHCSALTQVNIDALQQVYDNSALQCIFEYCTSLPCFYFKTLSILNGTTCLSSAFKGCTSLQSVWFYALAQNSFGSQTGVFSTMLKECSNVTVHFPMAIQATIGSWSDVTGGFGGTNTTVLYDIVTSLTGADGNTYTRSEKDSTSTATAWKYNGTLYYTSGVSNNTAGVNEPSVADTIYSDDACTTSVTTITAIA